MMSMALKVELDQSTGEVVSHEFAMGELTEPSQLFGQSRRLLSQLVARRSILSDDRFLVASLPVLMARDLSIRLSQGERTKVIGAPTVSFVDVSAADLVEPIERLRFYAGYNEKLFSILRLGRFRTNSLIPMDIAFPNREEPP